jgi:hypothetical protein
MSSENDLGDRVLLIVINMVILILKLQPKIIFEFFFKINNCHRHFDDHNIPATDVL